MPHRGVVSKANDSSKDSIFLEFPRLQIAVTRDSILSGDNENAVVTKLRVCGHARLKDSARSR